MGDRSGGVKSRGPSGDNLVKGDPFLYVSGTPERRQKLQNASSNCLWVLERTHCALGGRPLRRYAISSSMRGNPVAHSIHRLQSVDGSGRTVGTSDDTIADFEGRPFHEFSEGQEGARSSRRDSGSFSRRTSTVEAGEFF